MTQKSPQLQYLYSLARYGTKPGLVTMRAIMEELDHPEQKFKSIHITGTNGKGSTAALLAGALQAAGYKTGLYTSPHLYAFNERLQINGQVVETVELENLISIVRRAVARAEVVPTFFEFTTALAFAWFAEHAPDIVVIEVGMGGELDATNIITPEVAVITNIDLDHADIIGPGLPEITREKAGIIKPAVPVVVGTVQAESNTIITERAQEKNAPLYRAASLVQLTPIHTNHHKQTVKATGAFTGNFTLPLLGDHQRHNAACALAALHILKGQGWNIDTNAIQSGFAAARWEGRLEILSEHPFILVDGAHNDASFTALADFITNPTTKPPSYDVLLTGLKQGKEARVLHQHIAPLFKHVITTEGAYQPMPAADLASQIQPTNPSIEAVPDPGAALARALTLTGRDGTLIVAGSLYLIPIILAHLHHRELASPLIP